MSIKFKQKNNKRKGGSNRQRGFIVVGGIFVVVFVMGLGYLLTNT
jgi:hypothetical protein